MRAILIVVLGLAASLFAAAPAQAADYPTRVTFGEWIDGATWDTATLWYVEVTVRDTVVGQTLAGNSNCTTGAGAVHFSYTTSRGASGTLPDGCLDIHGKAFAILPDAARLSLLPGEVVTFSATFEATEAADYASSTAPVTARVTAIAIETYIDLYQSYDVALTATSVGLTAVLQPYGFDGPVIEAPAGSWTVWLRQADGTEDGRITHANITTLDMVFDDLAPGTRYTATARFIVAASDHGRNANPADAVFSFTTLTAPASGEVDVAATASSPDPVATSVDEAAAVDESANADAVPTSSTSPVLPVVAIGLVLLLAAGVITLVVLRSRRTIG